VADMMETDKTPRDIAEELEDEIETFNDRVKVETRFIILLSICFICGVVFLYVMTFMMNKVPLTFSLISSHMTFIGVLVFKYRYIKRTTKQLVSLQADLIIHTLTNEGGG
jgi:cbb3-type cytochrome oxidase subunit 3